MHGKIAVGVPWVATRALAGCASHYERGIEAKQRGDLSAALQELDQAVETKDERTAAEGLVAAIQEYLDGDKGVPGDLRKHDEKGFRKGDSRRVKLVSARRSGDGNQVRVTFSVEWKDNFGDPALPPRAKTLARHQPRRERSLACRRKHGGAVRVMRGGAVPGSTTERGGVT